MNLRDLGFSEFFHDQLRGLEGEPARVIRTSGRQCTLRGEWGEAEARIPKRLRRRQPVVGDWVLTSHALGERCISHLFDRQTQMARAAAGRQTRRQVIAANVDVVWIVTGLDGDFNLRRIERYIALVSDSGAIPVVLLTKAALHEDTAEKLAAAQSIARDIPVHAIDVVAGIGTDVLQLYLDRGRTVALVGSSGAGKSTIVNHLLGDSVMRTGAVREGDDRGRHTTTHRELFWLPGGGAIVDNPGMRELQLWIDGDGLEAAFADVAEAAHDCRFSDCRHRGEPGCAIQDLVARGELDESRVASYLRLEEEIAQNQRRRSEHHRRKDERAFGKVVREAMRAKRGKR